MRLLQRVFSAQNWSSLPLRRLKSSLGGHNRIRHGFIEKLQFDPQIMRIYTDFFGHPNPC